METWSASDNGMVEEIIFALNHLSNEKKICYDKEIEWLKSLENRMKKPMTKGELKSKINDYMIRNIIHLTKDPTLGDTIKEQMQGLIFNLITGDYWCECYDLETF